MPNATDIGGGDAAAAAAAAGGAGHEDQPPTGDFAAVQETVLFNITGTQASPAHHIAFQGLTFRDTAYTYFETHGLPSGGDWALAKIAAIMLVGTEKIDIKGNVLTRMDGNAVFIGGYNRKTQRCLKS